MQLLRPDQSNVLNEIEADYHNVNTCCKRVFQRWLETSVDTTWNQLIEALKRPSVQLYYFASQLEKNLIPECKITSSSNKLVFVSYLQHRLSGCHALV